MRKIFHVFVLLFFSIISISEAAVLTFDDVSGTDFWEYIPDGYGGFEWENMGVGSKYANPETGFGYGTVSGDYFAFNPYGATLTVSRDSLSDFTGARVTSAGTLFQNIIFTGYSEGSVLYEMTVGVGVYSPAWYDFSFYGTDTLQIETVRDYSYFVLDNFTWEEHTATAPVPEPSTLILLTAGPVTGIAGRRRVFKKVNNAN